ncbi:hypothetical protein HDV02_000277 [Globomyces sp. JEL0801]|nr:hypothetical protein HDV02_000277 [Globomyces sp. JEL0801]
MPLKIPRKKNSMSSQKIWVAYETPEMTYGPTRVSIDGCEYVADLLNEIKEVFGIPFPSPHCILFQPDGKTDIKTTATLKSLQDVGKDGNAPLIVKSQFFALRTNDISLRSRLVGQIHSVSINQSKLMWKYLTPVGSTCSTPVEQSPTHVDLSTIVLKLDQTMFYKNTTSRPCIILSVDPRPVMPFPEEPPSITIVLITGFSGKPLNEVMAEEEFKRVMPIAPTSGHLKTAPPISTTADWAVNLNHKVPSYVLCIPLKVYPQNIRLFEESVQLDAQNLEKLKMHILSLGEISANADFVELEEDSDDDDYLEMPYEENNRFISWDEIVKK